jgi:hypothetical protein
MYNLIVHDFLVTPLQTAAVPATFHVDVAEILFPPSSGQKALLPDQK